MSPRDLARLAVVLFLAVVAGGCATTKPFDYTNFRQSRPRSILVLPPINRSTDVRGTYGYLSTVTRPLAEMGYYVFPVAIVDQFMKENGLPTPGEMNQAPLDKLAKIFGADAVMYIVIDQYGQKYSLFNSAAIVVAEAKLVDAKTGLLLWQGRTQAQLASNNGGGGLVGALVSAALTQAVNASADTSHIVSGEANLLLFTGHPREFGQARAFGSGGPALIYGPYHPKDVGTQ